MEPTRQAYIGLSQAEFVAWYLCIAVAIGAFFWGVANLYRKYLRGRRLELPANLPGRIGRAISVMFSHAWLKRRDSLAGIAHAGIFYGFVALFLGTTILFFQLDIIEPLFGWTFWKGDFYLGYSLALDVGGALFLAGLTAMAVRRGILRPAKLDYARPDRKTAYSRLRYVIGDWLFLGTLLFLGASGFVLEALRIVATNPAHEVWSVVGWPLAQSLKSAGLAPSLAEALRHGLWWVHGLVALSFVASIPHWKAVHMLVAPLSIVARKEGVGRQLDRAPEDMEGGAEQAIGYASIAAMAPKHLLNVDACTKCGKCHEACPANASGYPLSPRDLVLDLRELSSASHGGISAALSLEAGCGSSQPFLANPIRPETLWSCMQCMACTEICPVGIEHVPMINQMRRALVDQGEMDEMLQGTLETIYNKGNSFGEPKRKRPAWTNDLEHPVKDIRKERAKYLWFVGDYASFDPRNQTITRTLARILQAAGVDFGILFDSEKTAGNDVRRAGEEGLWESLAEENIATIEACDFDYILTSDPHSFNTLRNEYPQLGARWEASAVLHHSQLLVDLIGGGAIRLERKLYARVTYHDPCHLGRYNGVYDPPREVMKALGLTLTEMPRNRDNSFCCGAGGGRIWMKELRDETMPRPSENRIAEAVALQDVDYFVVACPKDVTMFEDAIKTSGKQDRLKLREISEFVADAMGLAPAAKAL